MDGPIRITGAGWHAQGQQARSDIGEATHSLM